MARPQWCTVMYSIYITCALCDAGFLPSYPVSQSRAVLTVVVDGTRQGELTRWVGVLLGLISLSCGDVGIGAWWSAPGRRRSWWLRSQNWSNHWSSSCVGEVAAGWSSARDVGRGGGHWVMAPLGRRRHPLRLFGALQLWMFLQGKCSWRAPSGALQRR